MKSHYIYRFLILNRRKRGGGLQSTCITFKLDLCIWLLWTVIMICDVACAKFSLLLKQLYKFASNNRLTQVFAMFLRNVVAAMPFLALVRSNKVLSKGSNSTSNYHLTSFPDISNHVSQLLRFK